VILTNNFRNGREAFTWHSPFGFLPTTSVGFFRDIPPLPRVYKSIFEHVFCYSPAQGGASWPFDTLHMLQSKTWRRFDWAAEKQIRRTE